MPTTTKLQRVRKKLASIWEKGRKRTTDLSRNWHGSKFTEAGRDALVPKFEKLKEKLFSSGSPEGDGEVIFSAANVSVTQHREDIAAGRRGYVGFYHCMTEPVRHYRCRLAPNLYFRYYGTVLFGSTISLKNKLVQAYTYFLGARDTQLPNILWNRGHTDYAKYEKIRYDSDAFNKLSHSEQEQAILTEEVHKISYSTASDLIRPLIDLWLIQGKLVIEVVEMDQRGTINISRYDMEGNS